MKNRPYSSSHGPNFCFGTRNNWKVQISRRFNYSHWYLDLLLSWKNSGAGPVPSFWLLNQQSEPSFSKWGDFDFFPSLSPVFHSVIAFACRSMQKMPLHSACAGKQLEMVEHLVTLGANVSSVDANLNSKSEVLISWFIIKLPFSSGLICTQCVIVLSYQPPFTLLLDGVMWRPCSFW